MRLGSLRRAKRANGFEPRAMRLGFEVQQEDSIMSFKMRYCFVCGTELAVLSSQDFSPNDTCGKIECERVARQEARDDAFEDSEFDRDDYR